MRPAPLPCFGYPYPKHPVEAAVGAAHGPAGGAGALMCHMLTLGQSTATRGCNDFGSIVMSAESMATGLGWPKKSQHSEQSEVPLKRTYHG